MWLYLTGFVDPVIEPILWFTCSAIFFILGQFCFYKFILASEPAKPFFAGLMVFFWGWGFARILETIRRYFVGYYYDIVDNNFHIIGLNLTLRLMYVIISYLAIMCFFYTVEDKVFSRKSYFIFTIATLFEIVVSVLVYFGIPTLILTIMFFFVVGLAPIVLFFTFGIINFMEKRKPWLIMGMGLLFFVLGVAGDNPEAYGVVGTWNPFVIHYGTSLLCIIGMILIFIAVLQLYREV